MDGLIPGLVAAQAPKLPADLSPLIIAFLVVLVVGVLALVQYRQFYRKPSPDTALVRTGHGGLRVAVDSGLFVIPVLHIAEQIPLVPIHVDMRQSALSDEAARVRQLPNVFQIAVGRDEPMVLKAARWLGAKPWAEVVVLLEDIILDEFERLLAQENEAADQGPAAKRFLDGLEETLSEWGFTVVASQRE